MQPLCMGICTLLLSALLPWPGAGKFHVIGPEKSIIALVGKEAVLPCHLSPETDAKGMNVTWYQNDVANLVHHYVAGQDQLDQQQPEYRGRTEFLTENITKGQVVLRIHPILPSDDGKYRCYFGSSTFENEAQFTVLVTVSGTTPCIHIETDGFENLKMTCTSLGWYPKPEVTWRDKHGRVFSTAAEIKGDTGSGLFHVESSVTVDTSSLDVSCHIKNLVLGEEKGMNSSLKDALFPSFWPLILLFSVLLFLLICGTALLLIANWDND